MRTESSKLFDRAARWRHQPNAATVFRVESDILAVRRPGGFKVLLTVGGNLNFATARRQRLHEDLKVAVVIGTVSDGVSIRRKRWINVQPGPVRYLRRV